MAVGRREMKVDYRESIGYQFSVEKGFNIFKHLIKVRRRSLQDW